MKAWAGSRRPSPRSGRCTRPSRGTSRPSGSCDSHWGRADTYNQLKKFAEAVKDWDRAVELSPPDEQPVIRASRASSWVHAGMVAEAVAEVAELTKDTNWSRPVVQLRLRVFRGEWPDRRQEGRVRRPCDGVSDDGSGGGVNDAAQMKVDTDLDPLREREDFNKLLAELEKKFQPMQEVIPPPKEGTK